MKVKRISKGHYLVNGITVIKPFGDKLWQIKHSLGQDYALSFAEAKRIIQETYSN